MKVSVFLQARMGSTRLPGKVLKELSDGRTVVGTAVRRISRCLEPDEVVVVTSTSVLDDRLVDYLQAEDIPFFRGSEPDLVERYLGAMRAFDPEVVVRATGDSPFVDIPTLDRLVQVLRRGANHYVYVSKGPKGTGPEGFTRQGLERLGRLAKTVAEREHLGALPRRDREGFQSLEIEPRETLSHYGHLNFSIDTAEDFERARRLVQRQQVPPENLCLERAISDLESGAIR